MTCSQKNIPEAEAKKEMYVSLNFENETEYPERAI